MQPMRCAEGRPHWSLAMGRLYGRTRGGFKAASPESGWGMSALAIAWNRSAARGSSE
jgi:hypothetical protein